MTTRDRTVGVRTDASDNARLRTSICSVGWLRMVGRSHSSPMPKDGSSTMRLMRAAYAQGFGMAALSPRKISATGERARQRCWEWRVPQMRATSSFPMILVCRWDARSRASSPIVLGPCRHLSHGELRQLSEDKAPPALVLLGRRGTGGGLPEVTHLLVVSRISKTPVTIEQPRYRGC